MEKKTSLLTNLKKQVVALKQQLENIEQKQYSNVIKHKHNIKRHRSISHSSRFNSLSFDRSDLDRGIKKFNNPEHKFKNLSQIIQEKSALMKTPYFSSYRKA